MMEDCLPLNRYAELAMAILSQFGEYVYCECPSCHATGLPELFLRSSQQKANGFSRGSSHVTRGAQQMTALEARDKYKHLDALLSDIDWFPNDTLLSQITYDLWQAVRIEANATIRKGRQEFDVGFDGSRDDARRKTEGVTTPIAKADGLLQLHPANRR